jgi:hypothetical protein
MLITDYFGGHRCHCLSLKLVIKLGGGKGINRKNELSGHNRDDGRGRFVAKTVLLAPEALINCRLNWLKGRISSARKWSVIWAIGFKQSTIYPL